MARHREPLGGEADRGESVWMATRSRDPRAAPEDLD
jgi:hypothetical protein